MIFLQHYWYYIAIFFLIAIVLFLLMKSRKKPEYYDRVNENKKIWEYESKFNPTPIKYIKRLNKTYKVIGCKIEGRKLKQKNKLEERATKEWDIIEIKNMEWDNIKKMVKDGIVPDYVIYKFTVRMKNFFKLFFYGEKEHIYLEETDFVFFKTHIIKMDSFIDVVYYKGVFVPLRPIMLDVVTEDTVRVMRDLEVNASGHQEKEFSRIRSEYAHVEVMKEKEIEAEKEKKKSFVSSG